MTTLVAPPSTPRTNSLEYWAAKNPDGIAIVEGNCSITWSGLNDAANRVAQALTEYGVKQGDAVAVACQIRTEWAVLNSALAKLGCLCQGVSWRFTPSEVVHVLAVSGAVAFICDASNPEPFLSALEPLGLKLAVSIDSKSGGFVHWEELLRAHAVVRISPAETRRVVNTSGTTGLPKCIVSPMPTSPEEAQRTKEFLDSVEAAWGRRDGEVTLVTMPFSHGAGAALVNSSIAAGSKMVFQRRYNPEGVLQLIKEHRVNIWLAVPTMLKRLAALPLDVVREYDVSSLRLVVTGGAPVPQTLKEWFIDTFGSILMETYGASELNMVSCLTPDMQLTKPGSSGRLYKHVKVKVRDLDGQDLPSGEVGEFWFNTPKTIRNYFKAPPLDSSTVDEDGFFRSGDMGHVDEDGYLYITDRAKDMIIRGGQNIFPAEVEAVLQQHPSVQDAAVIGIPDDELGESVKAFVELKPDHAATQVELIEFASERLAFYKRPKSIDVVSQLPRNDAGKLLKRVLRAPYWAGRERSV